MSSRAAISLRFIDIGANLTDTMFQGIYNDKSKHPPDLDRVLQRSWKQGVERIIVTAGSLSESKAALALARSDARLYCTVGCHPTRAAEFQDDPDSYLKGLRDLIEANRDKVVAVGECGLDYDREKFCPRHVQQQFFMVQCQLALDVGLPMFLHCRAAHADLLPSLREFCARGLRGPGVLHTWDGSWEQATEAQQLGFYFGLNGCSLKTEEQLAVVRQLPLERLMLETDAPWCEIRPSHAGHAHISTSFPSVKRERWSEDQLVKSRQEPCQIVQVAEVVSGARSMDVVDLADACYANTLRLFFGDGK